MYKLSVNKRARIQGKIAHKKSRKSHEKSEEHEKNLEEHKKMKTTKKSERANVILIGHPETDLGSCKHIYVGEQRGSFH